MFCWIHKLIRVFRLQTNQVQIEHLIQLFHLRSRKIIIDHSAVTIS